MKVLRLVHSDVMGHVVKRQVKFAIQEGIALQLQPSWQTIGSAGPTTGRITSTGRLNRTGHQIRQDGTCDIGLKYDGQRKRDLKMRLLSNGLIR